MVEQQVINHMALGKLSRTERNGKNILKETGDGHESSASMLEMLENSPEDYLQMELESYFLNSLAGYKIVLLLLLPKRSLEQSSRNNTKSWSMTGCPQ